MRKALRMLLVASALFAGVGVVDTFGAQAGLPASPTGDEGGCNEGAVQYAYFDGGYLVVQQCGSDRAWHTIWEGYT